MGEGERGRGVPAPSCGVFPSRFWLERWLDGRTAVSGWRAAAWGMTHAVIVPAAVVLLNTV